MSFSPCSLDALNFLLADVRGALGPFLNVYLVSEHGWTQTAVGEMSMAAGLAGVFLQTPIGAAIDNTRHRRGALNLALALLALGTLVIWATHTFWPVTIANAAIAVVGDVFGPAVIALTAGLTARSALTKRIGRNSAFDHAGNIAIALLIGGVATAFSQRAIFLLVPVFAAIAIAVVMTIPASAIDHDRARGLDRDETADDAGKTGGARQASGIMAIFRRRPLLVFALSVALFHLANAAMLPLVGQELAEHHKRLADGMMSICVIAAQAVMLPVSIVVGHRADRWGHKRIFLAAFTILPLRAVLYTFSDDPAWLISVQVLDGIGAGIYGALTPVVIAALMRGTGRFNLAQGFIATTMGVGAAVSPFLAGVLHDRSGGYAAAWFALAGVAGLALLVFAVAMPETSPARRAASGRATEAHAARARS